MSDLMARAPSFVQWMYEPRVLIALAAVSTLLFVLSLIGVPWFFARMPADYFSRHEQERLGFERPRRPLWYVALQVLRNVAGILLLIAGLAMVILPGQGIATIFVGLMLLDFPGKHKLQRRLLAIDGVHRGINALRRRAGQPPLVILGKTDRSGGHRTTAGSKT